MKQLSLAYIVGLSKHTKGFLLLLTFLLILFGIFAQDNYKNIVAQAVSKLDAPTKQKRDSLIKAAKQTEIWKQIQQHSQNQLPMLQALGEMIASFDGKGYGCITAKYYLSVFAR